VVVGNFNPTIFTPDWLEKNELIGRDDAELIRQSPQIIISHQVTSFESDWFALQVLENQFSLTSKGVLSPALRDLAAGILQLVLHTPVSAVGLNFMAHLKIANQDGYYKIGDVLAPKTIWKDLFSAENDLPGLGNLGIRIQHGKRGEPVKNNDEIRLSVQPSDRVKQGIFVLYNDHHDVLSVEDDERTPTERAVSIVEDKWESAWQDAIRVFDGLVTKALAAS
jgi:hypothetical protein